MSTDSPIVAVKQVREITVSVLQLAKKFQRLALAKHGRFVACIFTASSSSDALKQTAALHAAGFAPTPDGFTVSYTLRDFHINVNEIVQTLQANPGRTLLLSAFDRPVLGVIALAAGIESTLISRLTESGHFGISDEHDSVLISDDAELRTILSGS